MTFPIIVTDRADADIEDIWRFGRNRWSRQQADRCITGLDRALRLIASEPEIVRIRHEAGASVRIYRFQSHLIVYGFDGATIMVFRVLHARSDWAAHLDD